ncbi:hypothetical protein JW930_04530 [Candidatus Woesearchaeota archaeon]|nr:hypothetical protein [Candidatus Woesearchaeota archaeon]
MDINKIQKLNKLAVDLKKHNIVDSKEEAIKQAENVVGAKHDDFSTKEPDRMREIEKEIRKIGFEVREQQQKISDIVKTLNEVLEQLHNSKLNIRPKEKISAKKDPTKPIDRNKVAPSEVSIEKYFYFGKK